MVSAPLGPDLNDNDRPALCVYYYGNQDDLIVDGVYPALTALSNLGPGFFTRHWLHGPHVRVYLPGGRKRAQQAVELIRPLLDDYLRRHPSGSAVDEAALLAQHRILAVQEHITDALTPLHPDNSIRLEQLPQRLAVIGSVDAVALIDDFYLLTQEVVGSALGAVCRGTLSRSTLAIELMWAIAHTEPAVTYPFISLRSHAEGFIAAAPDPDNVRGNFNHQYDNHMAALRERRRRLDEQLRAGTEVHHISPVLHVFSGLRPRIRELVRSRSLNLPTTGPQGEQRWDPGLLRHSTFHARLADDPGYRTMLMHDEGFASYRVVVNLLYLHLNRLGIVPFRRALLAHLAASTVEDYLGVRAVDLIGRSAS
ncbi:lantibiotic dehydratase C-terminal domain-containing protein [Nocardia sp. NPDC051052]|uniref:lantibiotic dehydratase C-terminal domain-containing protein n=1 Tax=Nocardia sp. NPDC051052 TaxID=3364322 RepID=UPI0037AD548F